MDRLIDRIADPVTRPNTICALALVFCVIVIFTRPILVAVLSMAAQAAR